MSFNPTADLFLMIHRPRLSSNWSTACLWTNASRGWLSTGLICALPIPHRRPAIVPGSLRLPGLLTEAFNDNCLRPPQREHRRRSAAEASKRQKSLPATVTTDHEEGGAQPDGTPPSTKPTGATSNDGWPLPRDVRCAPITNDPFTIKDFYCSPPFCRHQGKAVGRRTPNLTLPRRRRKPDSRNSKTNWLKWKKSKRNARRMDAKKELSPSFTIWSTRWST